MNKIIFSLLAVLLLGSCAKRNLAYLSDLQAQSEWTQKLTETAEPKIRPDDLLSITITSLNPEANALFNRGEILPAGATANYGVGANYTTSSIYREGYLVDKEGNIEFPVLGQVQLGGLTKTQAKDSLRIRLLKVVNYPIINIRYLNYRITVVGEVNRPATFTIPSEKINILEALGMAGDMTAYGKRENVLVMREEGGVRKATRLNLNEKEVLSSPYFYLMANDVVYVEPHKMKAVQASTDTRFLAIASSVITVLIVLVSRF
jgi:polysaccharide export outer membrane protein